MVRTGAAAEATEPVLVPAFMGMDAEELQVLYGAEHDVAAVMKAANRISRCWAATSHSRCDQFWRDFVYAPEPSDRTTNGWGTLARTLPIDTVCVNVVCRPPLAEILKMPLQDHHQAHVLGC